MRDERRRCWDYLNWLLKQRRGACPVSPEGRDDVLEFKVPHGSAGRLQGHRGENLRSIEKETNTFCFITDHNLDPGSRNELMLIFGSEKKNRYKARDLMEDAMAGRYRPITDGRGRGGGGGGGGGRRNDVCYDFQQGRCNRPNCKFSHESGGGGRRRDDSRDRGRGGRDRSPGRYDRRDDRYDRRDDRYDRRDDRYDRRDDRYDRRDDRYDRR